MAHLSYEASIKAVYKGLILLAVVTLIEVAVSLVGAGHVIGKIPQLVRYVFMAIIAGLSIYKAYFIIFDFMHMKHEVKSLAWTVLMPVGLLTWALIAFFQEGSSFGSRRQFYGNTSSEAVVGKKAPINMAGDVYPHTPVAAPKTTTPEAPKH
jgi:cytochrome c oxidase subunit IV